MPTELNELKKGERVVVKHPNGDTWEGTVEDAGFGVAPSGAPYAHVSPGGTIAWLIKWPITVERIWTPRPIGVHS